VGELLGGIVGFLLSSRHAEAALSLTVSNASHRDGSIQRAREWREFIRTKGMAVFANAWRGLPCSHGAVCGRALRAFLERYAV
jgi:hypothetical protein